MSMQNSERNKQKQATGVMMKVRAGDLMDLLDPLMTACMTTIKPGFPGASELSLMIQNKMVRAFARNGHIQIQTALNVKSMPKSLPGITVNANDFKRGLNSFARDARITVSVTMRGKGEATLSLRERADSVFNLNGVRCHTPELAVVPPGTNTATMRRRDLLATLQIGYATGKEKYRPEFLRAIMRLRNDGFRAIAGDGGRFIFREQEEVGSLSVRGKFDLQFHRDYIPILQRILRTVDASDVQVIDGQPDNCVTRFEVGRYSIDLFREHVKWPDENKFLLRKSPFRIVCRLADWLGPIHGCMATYTREMKDQRMPPVTSLLIDAERKRVTLFAGQKSVVIRSLPILDVERDVTALKQLTIRLTTTYLDEMVRQGQGNEFVQLEFVDDDEPVIIRYTQNDKITDDFWQPPVDGVRAKMGMFVALVKRAQRPPTRENSSCVDYHSTMTNAKHSGMEAQRHNK